MGLHGLLQRQLHFYIVNKIVEQKAVMVQLCSTPEGVGNWGKLRKKTFYYTDKSGPRRYVFRISQEEQLIF
jgi:hypothetical protein